MTAVAPSGVRIAWERRGTGVPLLLVHGLGYARWAYEVADQERELGLFFDTVIVCSVTGSTHAGMVAGFAAQERPRRVIGIDGSAKPRETLEQVPTPPAEDVGSSTA